HTRFDCDWSSDVCSSDLTPSGPLIIRTAQLSLTTNDFAHTRESINRILISYTGYIAQLEMSTPAGEARSLEATLRIPAAQLDEEIGRASCRERVREQVRE